MSRSVSLRTLRHLACLLCPAPSLLAGNPCTGLPAGRPAWRYTEPPLYQIYWTTKERILNIGLHSSPTKQFMAEGRRGGDAATLNTTDEWTCEMGMRLTSSR
ncbi:hypothetical protein JB92DRAFT_2972633 [Gautieria morchelliformis]|nr:hypothetical protein JB92DRAFT_2972633 [Gautieria morchelliformis]